MKGLTVLMHVRATVDLQAGRPAEAFDDLKLGFRLSDSLRDEPLLIDHLVRIATWVASVRTVASIHRLKPGPGQRTTGAFPIPFPRGV
jgi:hypothetical protein